MRKSLLLCLLALSFSSVGFAQSHGSKPLSDDDETALKQTQEMMRDQKQVQDYAAKNPGAAAADANLKNVLGPDTGEGYALSAEILETITREAGGDPAKMQKILQEAMRNPAAFAAKLPEAQKAKVKALADKVEARQNTGPAPH